MLAVGTAVSFAQNGSKLWNNAKSLFKKGGKPKPSIVFYRYTSKPGSSRPEWRDEKLIDYFFKADGSGEYLNTEQAKKLNAQLNPDNHDHITQATDGRNPADFRGVIFVNGIGYDANIFGLSALHSSRGGLRFARDIQQFELQSTSMGPHDISSNRPSDTPIRSMQAESKSNTMIVLAVVGIGFAILMRK